MKREDDSDEASKLHGSRATSRSLIVRLQNDDSLAWDRLVTLYSPLVFHWCRKMDLPEQDLADVFQEVFHAVAKNVAKFRRDRPNDTFRGWLRTITRNKVYDFYRRQGREPKAAGGTDANLRMSQLPADTDDDETDEQQAHNELFHRALDLIRTDFEERTWKAFWRVVVDGQTPNDIGEEMEMRPGTIRVAKSRVLKRLREELGDLIE